MRKYQLSKTNKLKINLLIKSFFLVNFGGGRFWDCIFLVLLNFREFLTLSRRGLRRIYSF